MTTHRIDPAGLAKGLGVAYVATFGLLIVVVCVWVLSGRSLRHPSFEDSIFGACSIIGAWIGGYAAVMVSRRRGSATGIAVGAAIVALRVAHHLMTMSSDTPDISAADWLTTAAVVPIAWLGASLGAKRRSREDRRVERLDGWRRRLGGSRRAAAE